jgi:hypothetical protein
VLAIRLDAEHAQGRLYQRRRSRRLSLRLSPVRLVPLVEDAAAAAPAGTNTGTAVREQTRARGLTRALVEDPDVAPVARLSDVSATGAAIVVDTPLAEGTTVSIEFELPGEAKPFTIRGRVVTPAVALHGEMQPQPDGLPGFRRGIEFLGHSASRESRRLAGVLTRLLPQGEGTQAEGPHP